MLGKILDSETVNAGGIATITSGFAAKIYEVVTMNNVNDFLQLILAIGGCVFLWHKIQGQILDNKNKRKNLKDE